MGQMGNLLAPQQQQQVQQLQKITTKTKLTSNFLAKLLTQFFSRVFSVATFRVVQFDIFCIYLYIYLNYNSLAARFLTFLNTVH